MTKIYTAEHLEDALSNAIAWRKKELATLKSLVRSGSHSRSKLNCLIRSGIAILYAHWEGFIKEAGTAYLEFVSRQRLTYQELTPNFIAFAMKKQLNEARQTNKAIIYNQVVEFFLSGLIQRSQIAYDDSAINIESNLSSAVLRNIVHMLGLDYSAFESKEKLIDEKLLKRRNHIAHGKYLTVDETEFAEIYDQIIVLMDIFRNQISNSAVLEKYKNKHE